jgi:hypothetical protein
MSDDDWDQEETEVNDAKQKRNFLQVLSHYLSKTFNEKYTTILISSESIPDVFITQDAPTKCQRSELESSTMQSLWKKR